MINVEQIIPIIVCVILWTNIFEQNIAFKAVSLVEQFSFYSHDSGHTTKTDSKIITAWVWTVVTATTEGAGE